MAETHYTLYANPHLFAGIRKGQEPVLVQTFGAEAAIERFNERIVGRFAGA